MTDDISIPRLAATLLLLRESPLEVLMVRRNGRGTFASALVFPGGVLSEEDELGEWSGLIEWSGSSDLERHLRITALRETFEETGILPLVETNGRLTAISDDSGKPFIDLVRTSGGRLPLDRLVHYAHWITPDFAPKRFDTHFFLLAAPRDCSSARSDGAETVALEWRKASEVLEAEPDLPFATKLNLTRLTDSDNMAHALEAARARPRYTVQPSLDEDGLHVVIPLEAGYGITRGKRHSKGMPG